MIDLPLGPRDAHGIHEKNALDDMIVRAGPEVVRELIDRKMRGDGEPRLLADYRNEIQHKRMESLASPGMYFDGSEVGAGKSHSSRHAAEACGTSATIAPSHDNCREGVEYFQSCGLPAAAYPKLSGETCQQYENAERAMSSGLSCSQVLCPTCQHRDSCDYQAELEEAESAEPVQLQRRLFETIQRHNLCCHPDAMRLILAVVSGKLVEVVVSVSHYLKPGKVPAVSRSIVGFLSNEVPGDAVTWICDASATAQQVEQMVGRPVVDCTPKGRLQNQQEVRQVPLDVTHRTSPSKLVGIIRAILVGLSGYERVGVITHRKHLPTILGTAREGKPVLDTDLRSRIAKSAHFRDGTTRGSNAWYQECDCLVILGTPRVPQQAIVRRLYQMGLGFAAGRDEDWTGWGMDTWLGRSVDGKPTAVRRLAYRDHDWGAAYSSIVTAELIQALGRARAALPDGIPALICCCEPLGLPLIELEPLNDQDMQVLRYFVINSLNSIYFSGLRTNVPVAKVRQRLSDISRGVKTDRRSVYRALSRLADRGYVVNHGGRSGWSLSATPPHYPGPAGRRRGWDHTPRLGADSMQEMRPIQIMPAQPGWHVTVQQPTRGGEFRLVSYPVAAWALTRVRDDDDSPAEHEVLPLVCDPGGDSLVFPHCLGRTAALEPPDGHRVAWGPARAAELVEASQ